MPAAVALGAVVVSGVMQANAQRSAARNAANAQTSAAQAGMTQLQRVSEMLAPYVQTGQHAVTAQGNLVGLGGATAQQEAVDALKQGPMYQSMLKLGNDNILQNAAATGGLRGGNTERALALLGPQVLSQVIQQQYGNLGGLTTAGENAAGMQQSNQNNLAGLLQQQGAATAGADLAAGRANAQAWGIPGRIAGMYLGGGFSGVKF